MTLSVLICPSLNVCHFHPRYSAGWRKFWGRVTIFICKGGGKCWSVWNAHERGKRQANVFDTPLQNTEKFCSQDSWENFWVSLCYDKWCLTCDKNDYVWSRINETWILCVEDLGRDLKYRMSFDLKISVVVVCRRGYVSLAESWDFFFS